MKFAQRLAVFASLLLLCATASWGQFTFTSSSTASGTVGIPFNFQLVANNTPSSFAAIGLPALGLVLSDPANGLISGTPTATGTVTVALTAINSALGNASGVLTITISTVIPVPVIASTLSTNGIVGVPFSYHIVAANATSYAATSLPPGLTVDTTGGLISGTPQVEGTYNVTLTAANAAGTGPAATLALDILPPSVGFATDVIFSEGFESNFPSGWQIGDANASGTPAYWAAVQSPFAGIATPDGSSRMAYCAGFGYGGSSDSPTYQNNMRAYMQQTFDLSGSSSATLWFQSRIPNIEVSFDYCNVLVSTNAGANWVNVWRVSRNDAGWTSEVVPLNDYAGKVGVTIRFEFDSDSTINGIGWFLDNIAVKIGQGDRFDNATVISRGTNYNGSVYAPNELDVTRVTLRQGYTYVITATPGSLIDPQMWLFDPNRIQLAYNDDDPTYVLGLGSRITYTCTATGNYYVQVGGMYGSTGGYTLLVTEQPAYADIQAVSVSMTLPAGDPRGQNPVAMDYVLQNNGPMSMDNGETYNYEVDVYLSTNGVRAGTGELIGRETIQLALASGDNTDIPASLGSYTFPFDMLAGSYYVWLHVTPLSGSPTDSKPANNWVVNTNAVVSLPPPSLVTLAGIVTTSGGTARMPGVAIVALALDGSTTNSDITDGNGNYSVTVSSNWTGTVTPSTTNGVAGGFAPAVRTYTIGVTNNLASQNFAWSPPPVLAGKVTKAGSSTGVAGVALVFLGNDGSMLTTSTDVNGNYSLTVSNNWSGTITPSIGLVGSFAPLYRGYTNVNANQTAQNYTWGAAPVISGKIVVKSGTGLAGVQLVFSSGGGTVTTDSNGNYSNVVTYGWTGTVTPSTTGLGGGFSPVSKSYSKLTAKATSQNYTWIPPPVISGKITKSGTSTGATNMTITFSGVGATQTDGSGNFIMTVPYNWTGTVTPSSISGGTFSPTSKSYSKLTANKTGQNFTWKAPAAAPMPKTATVAATSVAATETRSGGNGVPPSSWPTGDGGRRAVGAVVVIPTVAPPRQLLHTTGMVRWTGVDAVWARQSPDLLRIALVHGVVKVVPVVPVVASGDMITTLEFVDGLPGMTGVASGDLVVVQNVQGVAVAGVMLPDTVVVDNVLFLTPGSDAVLTWDLLLLRP